MVGTKTNLMLKMQFYMETWRIPIYIQRERERDTHTHTYGIHDSNNGGNMVCGLRKALFGIELLSSLASNNLPNQFFPQYIHLFVHGNYYVCPVFRVN
jgi:hypothetical protein